MSRQLSGIRLSEFCEVVQGGRHKLSGNDFVDDGFPAFGAGGMNGFLPVAEFDRAAVVLSSIGARCGKCFYADGEWSSLANTQVILPNPAKASARFLWWQLNDERRWPRAGTAQPFIKPAVVKTHRVFLPPLAEQRRIADILDRADAIRRKREESLKLVDDLLQSVFLDMFGDPVSNPKGWPVNRLRDLVSPVRPITYGIVKPGPDVQGGTPYVRVVDLKNGTVDFSGLRRTSAEIAHSYRRSRLDEGDILVSIRGHVGRCAMVPSGAAGFNITQDTARVAPTDGTTSEYLMCALASVGSQRWMSRYTKGASVQGINLGDLRNLPIAQPPLDLQSRFSRAFATIISCSENARRALQQQDQLTASLTQRAFRGEL